jgi:hypothetical protein
MRPKYTLYAVPAGLVHISGAFTDDELVDVERALDAERWLSSSQAMCFSPLPTWVTRLGQKIKSLAIDSHAFAASDTTDDAFNFCQCIVNQYSKVDGLTPHVDLHAFGDVICSADRRGHRISITLRTMDPNGYELRVRAPSP